MNPTVSPATTDLSQEAVLEAVAGMIHQVLDKYDIEDVEITMDSSLHDDLELESIDLVTLAGLLQEKYGDAVNLAEFLAEMDLDDVIALRVGQLVDFVRTATGAAGA